MRGRLTPTRSMAPSCRAPRTRQRQVQSTRGFAERPRDAVAGDDPLSPPRLTGSCAISPSMVEDDEHAHESDDIDERLAELAGAVLGVEPDGLTDSASPETLDSWTSIVHLSLIAAVEEAFSIHLSVSDIYAAQSFGVLRRIVRERLGSNAS